MQPVVTSVQTPVEPRQTTEIVGTNFGFVEAVFFSPAGGGALIPAAYFQIASGELIIATIPPGMPTNADFNVELVSNEGEISNTSASTLIHINVISGFPTYPTPSDTPNPLPLPIEGTSVGLDRLRSLTRLELGDNPIGFQASVTSDGQQVLYDLPHEHIDSTINIWAVPPGSPNINADVVDPSLYNIDSDNGNIIFNVPFDQGTRVYINGTYYRFFTPDVLDTFIQFAFAQVAYGRNIVTVGVSDYGYRVFGTTAYDYDNLPDVEYLPTAILAAVEALHILVMDAAYDININEDGATIDRGQRYSQLVSQLQLLTARWEKYASLLNIGLDRFVVGTLRRVSRQTNRFVPIYVEKEYDDYSLPDRVLPIIDHNVGEDTEFLDPWVGGTGYGYGGGGFYP